MFVQSLAMLRAVLSDSAACVSMWPLTPGLQLAQHDQLTKMSSQLSDEVTEEHKHNYKH